MTSRWWTVLGLVALGAASACGDSSPTQDDPGLVDEGTSCAEAVALSTETNGPGGTLYAANGTIDGTGDIDFFTFPIDAGEWIDLLARADPSGNGLDAQITLFDASGSTQLAYNDDSVTGGLDSEISYLPTTTGTACVSVSDFGGADTRLDYQVLALPVDFDLYPDFNLDTEPNNSTTSPQTGLSHVGAGSNIFTKLLGDFESPGDVDVYQWDVPAGAVGTVATFAPSFGPDGYGSTTEVGRVEIFEPGGTQVYARLDSRTGAESLVAPVSPSTTYFVAVHPPESGASGDNPFYVLPIGTSSTENDQETDDVANDDSASAEAPSPIISRGQISYFIAGTLPSPGDTDWWKVTAGAGDEIALFCASWRFGSGVRDATFSIYDDPGSAPLQTEQEVENGDVSWTNGVSAASMPAVTTTQSGPHYLRVEATTYDAEVSGTYYQCGVSVLTD